MTLSWWGKGLWQIYMHHWTVHQKVEFPRFPPDVRSWGVHFTTFDPELRNERLTLISSIGFPAILSTLQPFYLCISNRKYSKLTFWNDPLLMGKRFMANMHAALDSTCKSRIFRNVHEMSYLGGSIPQLLILNTEMKDLHWYLLWGFLQYQAHYSHFKSAFSIKNRVNYHFQMASSWWGKGLW